MNPNHLRQLAVVVQQGSISRACEHLFVTQPTLTRTLQQLEARVGAPLLVRSRHGVEPTDIGARLARVGERILAESEHGDEVIRQWHSGYHHEFVIGIDPLWEFATVARMTTELLAQRGFVFHLRTASAATQIGLLQDNQLDFLISHAHLSVAQSNLNREILFRDRTGIFAGRCSRLVGQTQPVPSDVLAAQGWMIAGASAGFLAHAGLPRTGRDPARPHAARMALTGSIRSTLHLLETTDLLVRLPARLTLMTGLVQPTQLISAEAQTEPRQDLALWSRADRGGRPEMLKVRELVAGLMVSLDRETPTFGLDL